MVLTNVVRTMNPLKAWVVESRAQQRRYPEMYLAAYPELIFDETSVMMTQETQARIKHHCGRYDGCYPTGEYCGKIFLRGVNLCWFGIDTTNQHTAMTMVKINYREIVIVDA